MTNQSNGHILSTPKIWLQQIKEVVIILSNHQNKVKQG